MTYRSFMAFMISQHVLWNVRIVCISIIESDGLMKDDVSGNALAIRTFKIIRLTIHHA
jgi:hypothetical protein